MTQASPIATANKLGGSVADSFMAGVVAMAMASVLQRVVGLGRNLGFCTFLSDAQLGQWALANSFFVIAAPMVVFGLPGSFGKFAEYFRRRGCLGQYFVRTLAISCLGLTLSVVGMLCVPGVAAWTLYGEAANREIVGWTAITFVALTSFNLVNDVVLSLRMVRVGALMQFLNSFFFAVLGIAGIWCYSTWVILLPIYALACVLAAIPGLWCIYFEARSEMKTTSPMPAREMWSRIVPFAIAMWSTNFLSNLFDLSDRYMLLHLCRAGQEYGQSLVGQYYCGRIIPNLLYSLALMFSGILLPYLSVDWEHKRIEALTRRMEQVLPALCIAFTSLSAAALVASPLLFQWGLHGRYPQAESIMVISLVQTTWASVAMIASMYLLCAEKCMQNGILLACAVCLNIGLNWPLIVYFDLFGSVVATAVANLALMLATLWRVHREGCRISARTVALSLLPLVLLLGPIPTFACLLIVTALAGRTNWILNSQDRNSIDQVFVPVLRSLRMPVRTLWPLQH